MLQEASGPINFTTFLNMFGEKLTGEPQPSASAAVSSKVQALHMKSDLWQRPRGRHSGTNMCGSHISAPPSPRPQLGAPPSAPALPPAGHWWPLSPH